MFIEEFKANKSGNKLYIDYFQGNITVDVESNAKAYEYLIGQAATLDTLKSNVLKEADKFIND